MYAPRWPGCYHAPVKNLRHLRAALGLVTLLTAVAVGWVWDHRGYRGIVYYQAITETTTWDQFQGGRRVSRSDTVGAESWIDPQARVRRRQGRPAERWYDLQRGNLMYSVFGQGDIFPMDVPTTAQGVEAWRNWDPLRHGGWGGMGRFLLGKATGSVFHQRLFSRLVLRFAVNDPFLSGGPRVTIWLDASTLVPLREQSRGSTKARYVQTDDWVTQRLAPGTLSYTFFMLPLPPHTSFWDRVGAWFQDNGMGGS